MPSGPSKQTRADVLLTEASLSHLAAALLLSRDGHRVCLLQGEGAGGVPPWALPPLGILPPAGAGTLLEELFIAADLPPPTRRAFRAPPVLLQVIWPGVRIDVAREGEAYRKSLVRELGEGEAAKLERFEKEVSEAFRELLKGVQNCPAYPRGGFLAWLWKNLPPPGVPSAARRFLSASLSEALAQAGLGEKTKLYVRLLLLGLGSLGDTDPPLAAAGLALSPEYREHLLLAPAETPELRDLLAVQLLKRGVELRRGSIREIRKGPEGTWEVETTSGDRLNARALVEGDFPIQRRLSPRKARFLETRTIGFSIDPKAVPVGMCPRGVSLEDPAGGFEDGNFLLYSIEPPAEGTGPARLWATILAGPWAAGRNGGSADSSQPPENVRQRTLRHLGKLLPYLPDFLEKTAWLPAPKEATYVSGAPFVRQGGLGGASYRLSGNRHYALGRANLPGLGAWGEMKAAFSLASLVRQSLGK
ncbi:MAG: hypothetical protein AB1405_05780 [Bdellovibrionota bacterium]